MTPSSLPLESNPVLAQWTARQEFASSEAVKLLAASGKAQIHWFCGTGKTRIAAMVAQKAHAKRVCVVAPTLTVLFQHMEEFREVITHLPFHAFCGIKDLSEGDNALDYTSSLDRDAAREFLKQESFVLFTTYLSLSTAADLMTGGIDLCIFDEAHRTAGKKGKRFGFGLTSAFKTKARLFLTATPIFLNDEDAGENFSMEDSALYGAVADRFPYRDAQKMGLLCDYKIVVSDLGIEAKELSLEDRFSLMASELISMMEKHGLKKAITCHRSVAEAIQFQQILQQIAEDCVVLHINGLQSHAVQKEQLDLFKTASYSVMTQVRCMNEGVNVPAVDLVYFANPKTSDVSILQAVGRSLRRDPLRPDKVAVLGLPLHGSDAHEFVKLRRVLQTLRFADQRVDRWLVNSRITEGTKPTKDTPQWIEIRASNPEKWRRLSKRAIGRTLPSNPELSKFFEEIKLYNDSDFRTSIWSRAGSKRWKNLPLLNLKHPMAEQVTEFLTNHPSDDPLRDEQILNFVEEPELPPLFSLMRKRQVDFEGLSNKTGIEIGRVLSIIGEESLPTKVERRCIARVLGSNPYRLFPEAKEGYRYQGKELWIRRQLLRHNTNMRQVLLSAGLPISISISRIIVTDHLFEIVSAYLGGYNPRNEPHERPTPEDLQQGEWEGFCYLDDTTADTASDHGLCAEKMRAFEGDMEGLLLQKACRELSPLHRAVLSIVAHNTALDSGADDWLAHVVQTGRAQLELAAKQIASGEKKPARRLKVCCELDGSPAMSQHPESKKSRLRKRSVDTFQKFCRLGKQGSLGEAVRLLNENLPLEAIELLTIAIVYENPKPKHLLSFSSENKLGLEDQPVYLNGFLDMLLNGCENPLTYGCVLKDLYQHLLIAGNGSRSNEHNPTPVRGQCMEFWRALHQRERNLDDR